MSKFTDNSPMPSYDHSQTVTAYCNQLYLKLNVSMGELGGPDPSLSLCLFITITLQKSMKSESDLTSLSDDTAYPNIIRLLLSYTN